jgi:hypothetical protein
VLTQKRLKELLNYDQETGAFTWLVAPNGRIHVGQIAGSQNADGYIQIKIDRVTHRAHRLACLYMTGKWPEEEIDHRNTVTSDNRWKNLREATRVLNAQNSRRARKVNKSSGLLGVTQRNKGRGFQARIRFEGKEKRLGTFSTAEMAHEAYVKAKRELHLGCTI